LATSRCVDCGGRLPSPRPGAPGRPPKRCPDCRRIRRHRAATPAPPADLERRRQLRAVAPPSRAGTPEPPTPPAPAPLSVAAAVAGSLEDELSLHPHDEALSAVAQLLALTLDHPVVRADGRVLASVSKELRATLAELAGPAGKGGDPDDGDDADDTGFGDLSTPVLDTAEPQ
jgi:hypothetical protein